MVTLSKFSKTLLLKPFFLKTGNRLLKAKSWESPPIVFNKKPVRKSVTYEEGLAPSTRPKLEFNLACATLEDHRCHAPPPHRRFTDQDQLRQSRNREAWRSGTLVRGVRRKDSCNNFESLLVWALFGSIFYAYFPCIGSWHEFGPTAAPLCSLSCNENRAKILEGPNLPRLAKSCLLCQTHCALLFQNAPLLLHGYVICCNLICFTPAHEDKADDWNLLHRREDKADDICNSVTIVHLGNPSVAE
ncbi:hypothetical protein CXB51_025786 [Gossypium anomalum]|uniref:Uncharacterized protein n=1 Tax=Gossypium anomalum TaxID=47600 RepID=A0A8J6CRT9_9ROSI|nr:hypothetical protein CXB51_025786 [Gossypium anomalum]